MMVLQPEAEIRRALAPNGQADDAAGRGSCLQEMSHQGGDGVGFPAPVPPVIAVPPSASSAAARSMGFNGKPHSCNAIMAGRLR